MISKLNRSCLINEKNLVLTHNSQEILKQKTTNPFLLYYCYLKKASCDLGHLAFFSFSYDVNIIFSDINSVQPLQHVCIMCVL